MFLHLFVDITLNITFLFVIFYTFVIGWRNLSINFGIIGKRYANLSL